MDEPSARCREHGSGSPGQPGPRHLTASRVSAGPCFFLSCPIGIEDFRTWFIDLWNNSIIPYLQEGAKDGIKVRALPSGSAPAPRSGCPLPNQRVSATSDASHHDGLGSLLDGQTEPPSLGQWLLRRCPGPHALQTRAALGVPANLERIALSAK